MAKMHFVQNHLIETASSSTGSMLIWDTGEYSILPYHDNQKRHQTDHELSDSSADENYNQPSTISESEKLHQAFKNVSPPYVMVFFPCRNNQHLEKRKIRLRLHGTRLPPNYTLSMRLLTSNNRHEQPKKPVRKRRRRDDDPKRPHHRQRATTPQTSSEEEESVQDDHSGDSIIAESIIITTNQNYSEIEEQEDEQVRLTNAYPGATNSINSIHQRRWYLSMDRHASGFMPLTDSDGAREWVRRQDENGKLLGFEPFFVRGRDHERSVVTGRTADDVMEDEGVEGFTGRKGWRAMVE
ncbi:MAG: hypothetical protein Q9204_005531 [Flavoplaca sp. TL-2023a]